MFFEQFSITNAKYSGRFSGNFCKLLKSDHNDLIQFTTNIAVSYCCNDDAVSKIPELNVPLSSSFLLSPC